MRHAMPSPFFIGITILILHSVLIAKLAKAETFLQRLSLEIGGVSQRISPDEFNEFIEVFQLGGIDRMSGIRTGISYRLNSSFSISLRSGYFFGSTDQGEIYFCTGPPPNFLCPLTNFEFQTATIPTSVGLDFRIRNKATALALNVAWEVHYFMLTYKLHENKTEGIPEYKATTNETFLGITGSLAVEWYFTTKVAIGLRGGYRLTEEDYLLLPSCLDCETTFDISGAYGSVYFLVLPWAKGMLN